MAKANLSKKTPEFTKKLRAKYRAKRSLVSRNMTEIFRARGVKRAAKHVGNAIYDYDVTPHLCRMITLALYLCQIQGYKTVKKTHMQAAQHFINGIKPIPPEMLVMKVPMAMRTAVTA